MRIQQRLQEARKRGGALLPYFTCGFPSHELTREFVRRADATGAAVVELGEPYSDSIADGPVIQESFYRALEGGHRLRNTFELSSALRGEVSCALVSMCSYSIVHRHGLQAFMQEAAGAGLDGVIIPDVPIEEAQAVYAAADSAGLCHIGLVAPTTTPARREQIARASTGFVYQIAAAGTTGERSGMAAGLAGEIAALRSLAQVPVCVGFGISTAAHVREVCCVADGAIVGSALIRRIAQSTDAGKRPEAVASDVERFLVELSLGLSGPPAR
jgi:tryptophan synthase alpha chain